MADYRPLERPTSFRKIAAAMWKRQNDPAIYGSLDIDMTPALAFLERYNREKACKVTVTHLVVRAMALGLARHPEINAKPGFFRILVRKSVDVFCQIATDGGRDLSGFKIVGADRLSLKELAETLSGAARRVRAGDDPTYRQSRGMFRWMPLFLVRFILRFVSFLTNDLNLHFPKLGMPRDPFGSAMVTSVGMMGIDTGFAPLPPISRCPMVVTVPQVRRRPWVVEGDRVEARPVLRVCAAFDHRIVDGASAGKLSVEAEGLLKDPVGLLTAEEREAWQGAGAVTAEGGAV